MIVKGRLIIEMDVSPLGSYDEFKETLNKALRGLESNTGQEEDLQFDIGGAAVRRCSWATASIDYGSFLESEVIQEVIQNA